MTAVIALTSQTAPLCVAAIAGVYSIGSSGAWPLVLWAVPSGLALAARPRARGACCWLGTARYRRPLDPATARKWRALDALGLDLHVVGFAEGFLPRAFFDHARFYLMPRLPFAPLRHVCVCVLAPWILAWAALRRNVRVVVAQSPFEAAIASALKMLLRRVGIRIAVVVESHGDFEHALFLYRDVPLAAAYRWAMRRAAAFGLRHADAGRAVSSGTRAQLQSWAPRLSVEVFPAWVDVETFGEGDRASPVETCTDVLFAGALAPVRGVEVLVDAFAQFAARRPDARLVIAGRDENRAYAAMLRDRVRTRGLEARVSWMGHLPPADLARLMDRARVLVLPSRSEGLARVLLEAMLRGTPVVGSRAGGTPELVREGETGYLVPPGDAAALAGALIDAFENPHLAEMGRAAREFARTLVSVPAYVEGHRRVLGRAGEQLGGG